MVLTVPGYAGVVPKQAQHSEYEPEVVPIAAMVVVQEGHIP